MMKSLIVDDEINVRDVIRFLGQWEKHGITNILEASNGQEAKTIIEKEEPEIIFTDIKMPGTSGMEMIEWLDSISYPGKVIFITGYNDYSFMRKAIKYSSFDYLLKPIEEEPFNHVLSEAVESWKQDEAVRCTKEGEDVQKLRIDQTLTAACMGEDFSYELIESSLPLAEQYEMTLLSFYHMHQPDSYMEALSKQLIQQALGRVFKLHHDHNLYLVLTICDEWLTAEEWMSKQLDIPVRLVSEKVISSLHEIPKAFQHLQAALETHRYRTIHKLNDLDAARRIKDIVSYVDTYYMEELSLERLSNLFFFSREHISRKFKQESGISLSKYVTKLRINQAKHWLRQSEESIYSISLMLGYKDEKYFSKLFKKEVGQTPFDYRNEMNPQIASR
ncbi:response regulator [Halobacillus sp. A5]|uniref:response regulator n=1 Tax=Halobacillus sp. A5 TaxID=2880263 RepID=UPI0020A64620|nr:response regulator [Halobacillus sp. A5]MCP3028483.1 response regulator [Halobacillus sp. A5]